MLPGLSLFGGGDKKDKEEKKEAGEEKKEEGKPGTINDPERIKAKEKLIQEMRNKEKLKKFYNLRPDFEQPRLRMNIKQKRENELLRRWSIRLWNIKITNLVSASYDPFVQFIIGGDFREVIKFDKSNNPYRHEIGEKGLIFRTDVIKEAERDQVRSYESALICEFDATYLMIEDQKLDIEIWDYDRWKLNDFKAHLAIPLKEIAEGNIMQTRILTRPKEDKREAFGKGS